MSEPETVESVVGETERRSVAPENQFRRSIYGLPVNVIVSIGQKKLSVAELLQLKPDTIIPLTAKIEDPIELVVDTDLGWASIEPKTRVALRPELVREVSELLGDQSVRLVGGVSVEVEEPRGRRRNRASE